jgi:hypothetical protein
VSSELWLRDRKSAEGAHSGPESNSLDGLYDCRTPAKEGVRPAEVKSSECQAIASRSQAGLAQDAPLARDRFDFVATPGVLLVAFPGMSAASRTAM